MRRRTHNFHVKRQILPGLSDILGGGTTLPSLPGPLGGATGILSLSIPTLSLPTSTTNTIDETSSIPSSSESSSETSTTPTPTVTPSAIQTVFETTSDGTVRTVTNFVDSVPSATGSVVPPPAPKSFLQNKVLSGVVFTLVGIVGLAIILSIATFAIRRRRKNRLVKEAISFDPTSMTDDHHHGYNEDRGSLEKRSVLTRSSGEHPASGYAESWGHPAPRAQPYSDGPNYPRGQDPNLAPRDGYSYPKPPPIAHEFLHGSDRTLPAFPRSEGINWGPSLTTFATPSGLPNPHVGVSTDERAQSQNRLLKVANN